MEHRRAAAGLSERWLLGHLRARHENQNLPAFVVIYDPRGGPYDGRVQLGQRLSAGGLPGHGVPSRRAIRFSICGRRAGVTPEQQRARLDHLARLNQQHEERYPGSTSWPRASLPTSWPTACRAARRRRSTSPRRPKRPSGSTVSTIRSPSHSASQCLLARRLVERGVRFVQLCSGANVERHRRLGRPQQLVDNHGAHAREVDKPIAGLITRSEAARPARRDPGHLAHRIRPHADLAARRRPRPQPGAFSSGWPAPESAAAR